jgi:glycosyltransferase involved in cell wall biosynthesis
MKIAIDLIPITGKDAGLQRYAQQLVEAIADFDKKNEYVLLLNEKIYGLLAVRQDNFTNVKVKTPLKIHFFWEQIYLPLHTLFKNFDILHFPISAPSYFQLSSTKVIVTVHDLTFILYPETMTKISQLYWSFFMKRGIKTAKRIIAVSKSTKDDLIKHYNIAEEKVKVIPEALTHNFSSSLPTNNFQSVKDKYGLPEKYLLYVGTLEPRKNIKRLLQAFYKVKSKKKFSHKLVIAGKKGWMFSDIFETVKKLGLENEVIFTDFVLDKDLPGIYLGAEVFVFPSLHEGFGLPPLEAMFYGIPVLTSNSSSLPEVVGDAGILVNPQDPDDIANGILRLLGDQQLRNRLKEKGLQRAHNFSLERMAKKTLEVYEEVTNENT